MRYRIYSLVLFLVFAYSKIDAATVPVHDPSVIIVYKDAAGNSYSENDATKTRTKYYYVFGTMLGAAYSTDMINWTSFTPTMQLNNAASADYYTIFKSEADFAGHLTTSEVLGNLWAPDIIYNKVLKKWCLYISLAGKDFKSSIIMLTATKIEGPYTKVGDVAFGGFTNSATSIARTDFAKVTGTSTIPARYLTNGTWNNDYSVSCIDPAVTYDENGKLWMAYGSWSGGIFLLKLDENTGLRNYTYNYGQGSNPVWSGTRLRYDPYMGMHLAGGYYVSGEGSYIRYIKDANGVGYYYMFVSMGFYSPEGGYTMRVFRSATIDGVYTDVSGDNAVFANWVFNYGNNIQYGMPIMQNFKYNWFSMAQVAQGHNSVLTDEDGSAYLVYHTKFDNGTAWHNVEVHQLFFNENGWPLSAPFEYRTSFGLSKSEIQKYDIVGKYKVITHNAVDYATLKSNAETEIFINADGTVTGSYIGTWLYSFAEGKQYITLTTSVGTFKGAVCEQLMDGLSTYTLAFTALNAANEKCIWGYKTTTTAIATTTNYKGQLLLVGDKQYTLTWNDYAKFNKQSVTGDFEIEYQFDNYTQVTENWHNWALAFSTSSETWHLRADAYSVGTFTGSAVGHSYNWDWATEFKEVYKNKAINLKINRIGNTINVFAYADSVLVYSCTAQNAPTTALDVYLGGESCYLDVKKISISQLAARQVVGTTTDFGTYQVPFNSQLGTTTSVTGDFELNYQFNNYRNSIGADNWDNYILRATSGSNTMLVRADAFAMDVVGSLAYTYNWTWEEFSKIMTNALVDFSIARTGTTITYKAKITARNAAVYNYQIVQLGAPTTAMSFAFSGEESMQDIFKIEKTSALGTDVISTIQPKENVASTEVYTQKSTLYINAKENGTAFIYTLEGKIWDEVNFEKGTNQFEGLPQGLYIVLGTKVWIE